MLLNTSVLIASRRIRQCARWSLMGTRWTWQKVSSPSNPGFLVVWILCALAVSTFTLGFAFQPSGSTPANVPIPPTLNLTFESTGPRYLSIYSFLKQDGAQQTELVIDATGIFTSNQPITHWVLGILGFAGRLCSNPAPSVGLVPLQGSPYNYEIKGNSRIPETSGQPFLAIRLCWGSDAPLIMNGSYLSAALSPILTGPGQQGTVTRSLVLSGTSLSSYSLAGGIAPTEVTARSWVWTDDISSRFQSQARTEIPIVASSLPGMQQDNQDIFLSGIFFGIAGGAAVSVVPAALDAFDRRKERNKHNIDRSKHAPDSSSQTT